MSIECGYRGWQLLLAAGFSWLVSRVVSWLQYLIACQRLLCTSTPSNDNYDRLRVFSGLMRGGGRGKGRGGDPEGEGKGGRGKGRERVREKERDSKYIVSDVTRGRGNSHWNLAGIQSSGALRGKPFRPLVMSAITCFTTTSPLPQQSR